MGRWDGLEEFVAVVDSGSFVAAARSLHVSTSHVSRAVARLEERLQSPLLYRTTRKVVMTELGRSVVEQFRRIIDEREEVLGWARGDGQFEGEIKISCSVALAERFVAPILRTYLREHPRLSITLDVGNRIVDLVSEGYDLAIRTGRRPDKRWGAIQIADRALILAASPAYVARNGEPGDIGALDRFECLIGSSATWHFSVNRRSVDYRPKGRWRCQSGRAIVDAALDDMGVCQLPIFYVRDHLHRGTLVELLCNHRPQNEPIWAVYSQRRYLAPKLRTLIERLQHQLTLALSTDAG